MPPPKFRAVLLDLSGTLHIDQTAIDGAVAAVQALRSRGKRVRFLTNTSKQSSQALHQQLVVFGFMDASDHDMQDSPLMTSILATRNYLLKHRLRPYCLMEDTSDLERVGIPLTPPHNAVVVGLAPSRLDYRSMNQAFQILMEQQEPQKSSNSNNNVQQPLIAIHKGKYYRDSKNELSLGPGPFVTGLEMATGMKALVMGKPSREFFQSALFPGIDGSETVMIGDDAMQDVQGAIDAGIGTCVLVKTGKYRAGDESLILAKGSNVAVCDSIADAVAYLLGDSNDQEPCDA